ARQAHNLKVTGSNPVPATIPNDNPSPVAQATGLASFLALQHRRAQPFENGAELAIPVDRYAPD
ncbi:hypothetical protein VH567_14410, partial [Sphingomonas sp. 4RDLI-65]|uniref:hypothetical protein n=1 Tax=Sphingomonas sp. 4RDLI-65 TaxID=3111641 RepID=UPI003C1EE2DA